MAVSQPRKNDLEIRPSCNEDGATVKVSFSICFATLREGVERDNGDNSKDDMCVVLFRKNGRADSVEYFEYHALHLAGVGGSTYAPPWAWEGLGAQPKFGPDRNNTSSA